MADVGIKISDEAIDAIDGNDEDMVVTSKFPVFKVHQEAADSLTLPSGDTAANKDITHNLGAESIILAYSQDDDGTAERVFVPGRTPIASDDGNFVYAASQDNSWNFRVSTGSGPGSDETFNFYYYVMSDQISF